MAKLRVNFEALKSRQKPGQSVEDIFKNDLNDDSFPQSLDPGVKMNNAAFAVIDPQNLINGYFDTTG